MDWEISIKNGDKAALDTIFDGISYKFGNSCQGIHGVHKPIKITDGKGHHFVYINHIINVENTKNCNLLSILMVIL